MQKISAMKDTHQIMEKQRKLQLLGKFMFKMLKGYFFVYRWLLIPQGNLFC